MFTYLLRRLLLMVPTVLAILVITFGVIRLRAPGLADEMMAGSQSQGEGRQLGNQARRVQNYLAKYRLAALDLPALLNLRGFESRQSLIEDLKAIERQPGSLLNDSQRIARQTGLWLRGHLALEPLQEILADPAWKRIHAPAAEAFVYSALQPRTEDDIARTEAWKQMVDRRNHELLRLLIDYRNDQQQGFVVTDPAAETKRQRLLAIYEENRDDWRRTSGRQWRAVLGETGFVDLMSKLFSGRLYSESRQEFALKLIGQRWQVSFWLNLVAITLAWTISIPLGIRSARRAGSLEDQVTTNSLFLLWSLPSFFVGALLLHYYCIDHQGAAGTVVKAPFPSSGLASEDTLWMTTPQLLLDLAWHGFLPLLTLTYAHFTVLSRYMRGSLLDQLHADYVRTAKAKGASDDRIVYQHALPNALIPMITLGSGLLAELFGGFLVVELLWSIPGLGRLLLDAAINGDAPLLMASSLISVGLLLIGILVADILYAVVDPRIRSRYA